MIYCQILLYYNIHAIILEIQNPNTKIKKMFSNTLYFARLIEGEAADIEHSKLFPQALAEGE